MAAKFQISEAVRDVLARSEIVGLKLQLPDKLERQLYSDTMKVIAGAGGTWSRKDDCHVFKSDPRELLGMAVATGQAINRQQLTQQFFTPTALAERMVEAVELTDTSRVLEPSAGHGALADVIAKYTQRIVLIENDSEACDVLKEKGFAVIEADFLTCKAEDFQFQPSFDAVIMNPPFTKGQDAKHILHAWDFVAPGGSLVALAGSSITSKQDRLCQLVRRLIHSHGTCEALPEDSFIESGTSVNAVMMVLIK